MKISRRWSAVFAASTRTTRRRSNTAVPARCASVLRVARGGGYRDVQLSVKIKSPAMTAKGSAYEGHRCEVQLHLLSFYNLKNAEGHATYTRIRNMAF